MSRPNSSLSELAAAVSKNVEVLEKFYRDKGVQAPSFEPGTPASYPYDEESAKARTAALEAMDEMTALLSGPTEPWINPPPSAHVAQQAVSRFGFAQKIPAEKGEATYAELSEGTGLSEPMTKRLVRTAINYRIFHESRPGVVAHTAASKLFADSDSLQALVKSNLDDLWPAAPRVIDALQQWPGSGEPNHSAFSLAHNTDKGMYEWFEEHPDNHYRFSLSMAALAKRQQSTTDKMLESYPWRDLGSGATLVDVGGATGHIAMAIARLVHDMDMKFVVQDLASPIANAQTPDDLKGRLTFQVHDFYQEQPLHDADAYFLRWILHGRTTSEGVKVLQALIPALKHGSHVIVCESVMPEPGEVENRMERSLRLYDLLMLQITNSMERGKDDWEELFRAVDPRFHLHQIVQPHGSRLALIDFVWKG